MNLPPLYDGLLDEVLWATETSPQKSFEVICFKSYILLTKIYKLKIPKQRKLHRGEEDNKETIFIKPKDENFLQFSSWFFTFPMHSQLVTSQVVSYFFNASNFLVCKLWL